MKELSSSLTMMLAGIDTTQPANQLCQPAIYGNNNCTSAVPVSLLNLHVAFPYSLSLGLKKSLLRLPRWTFALQICS